MRLHFNSLCSKEIIIKYRFFFSECEISEKEFSFKCKDVFCCLSQFMVVMGLRTMAPLYAGEVKPNSKFVTEHEKVKKTCSLLVIHTACLEGGKTLEFTLLMFIT